MFAMHQESFILKTLHIDYGLWAFGVEFFRGKVCFPQLLKNHLHSLIFQKVRLKVRFIFTDIHYLDWRCDLA